MHSWLIVKNADYYLRFSSSACTKDAALDKTSKGVSILDETLLKNDKPLNAHVVEIQMGENLKCQGSYFIWTNPVEAQAEITTVDLKLQDT